MEQLILEIFSRHTKDKKINRNNQHRFTKEKSHLINLMGGEEHWILFSWTLVRLGLLVGPQYDPHTEAVEVRAG